MRPGKTRAALQILWLLCICPALAFASSFPCSKASTPQEKAVCSTPKLSQLDDQLAEAYKSLKSQLSPEGALKVQTDQREWLVWIRQTCPEKSVHKNTTDMAGCLQDGYSERIKILKNGLQRIAGITFFPRQKVLTIPDEVQPGMESIDPGFGLGSFVWPEIDKPTPQQAAWNTAIRQQVVRMSVEGELGENPPQDFSPQSIANSDVNVDYILHAVNGRFIAIELENSTYGYGAAHPNEYGISFLWLLEKQRRLQATDVFQSGSDWEGFLGKTAYIRIKNSDRAPFLYDEAEARKSVMDAVKDPANWIPSASGLEIDFPEYSVAPRAAGDISVQFSWNELKPYLEAGFDPTIFLEH